MGYRIIMNDTLCHYGILGQKWGKRNGPPYPLGESDKSYSEKKAESKKINWKKVGKTALGVAAIAGVTYASYKYSTDPNFKKTVDTAVNNALGIKMSTVNSSKTVLREGGMRLDELYPGDWTSGDSSGLPKESDYKVTGIKTVRDQILKSVNPLHGQLNCTLTSISAFLQEKGIPVTAKDVGRQDLVDIITKCFKGVEVGSKDLRTGRNISASFNSYENASKKLVAWYGDNANGVISLPFKSKLTGINTAHTFNWSIKDGVVEFFDGQPDPPIRNIKSYFNYTDIDGQAIIAHLDDLEINYNGVNELLNLL